MRLLHTAYFKQFTNCKRGTREQSGHFLDSEINAVVVPQEPGPAKVAVTGSGIPEAEKVPDSSSIIWQEELSQREVEGATAWSAADLSPLGSLPPPAGLEGKSLHCFIAQTVQVHKTLEPF